MNLKEGLRVKIDLGFQNHVTGTIICFEFGDVGVQLDADACKKITGHSLGGRVKEGTGWWIHKSGVICILDSPYQKLIKESTNSQ